MQGVTSGFSPGATEQSSTLGTLTSSGSHEPEGKRAQHLFDPAAGLMHAPAAPILPLFRTEEEPEDVSVSRASSGSGQYDLTIAQQRRNVALKRLELEEADLALTQARAKAAKSSNSSGGRSRSERNVSTPATGTPQHALRRVAPGSASETATPLRQSALHVWFP